MSQFIIKGRFVKTERGSWVHLDCIATVQILLPDKKKNDPIILALRTKDGNWITLFNYGNEMSAKAGAEEFVDIINWNLYQIPPID